MELSSNKLHPFVSELRIVLLGRETNSVGNAILGREAFETGPTCSPEPQHCERARGAAAGRRLAVISCPDLITLSPPGLTQAVESCFFLSSPGPHVLLVVLKLDSFTQKDLTRVKSILEYWGDTAVNHTMVLIVSNSAHKNSAAQQLIKDCGRRVHEFNTRYMSETGQVAQLVEKMEQMVREKEGQHLSPEACRESSIQVDAEGVQDAVPPDKRRRQQDEEKTRKSSSHERPESVESGSSSAEDLEDDIWNLPMYKTYLPVTCGNKRGKLYRDKLAIGEDCIQVGTDWFTPPEFEVFGGKKNSKNWKKSILCNGTRLHDLIQDGHLKTVPQWRLQGGKKSPTHHRSRSLSPDFREESMQVEDNRDDNEDAEQHEEVDCGSSQGTPHEHSFATGSSSAEDLEDDIWNLPMYKTYLPVTCGNKRGKLYRDKLAIGEDCIQVGTDWFTPPEFEVFGGKKNSKNWKKSILCNGTRLHDLIQDGHLKTVPQWRLQGRKKLPIRHRSRSLSPDFRAEPMQVEDNGNDNEDAEQHEEVDLSTFKGNLLSVTCGSSKGLLHKSRFANGNSGKCIRTENKWLSPVDFVKQEPTLTDPNWMKSILCLGTPLKFLTEKRVLVLHSLLCECCSCSTEEDDLVQKNQENDDNCFICDNDDDMVCCDNCPRTFHHKCHIPTLDADKLGDKWMCTFCVMKSSQQWHYPAQIPHETALQKPIADHMLHCHYLLLFLYEEHQKLCYMVKGCEDVREKPTWLDKVVNALQSNQYSAVGDFVSDIQLILSNSSSSSRDTFGETGAKLKDIFEEEFRKIFKIQLNC